MTDSNNVPSVLSVTKVNIDNVENTESIKGVLSVLPSNDITYVNWPEEYPSKPDASFRIAHNGSHLFLHYFVHENEILAETREDNGPVWTDSCVEFFISFGDSPFYYNAEFSCIGTALLAYREKKESAEHADGIIMNSIQRYPSLGREPIAKVEGDFRWDMLLVIPVSAYWKSGLATFDGVKARANFYKCGDNLTVPHFLSWSPIHTESPNFHIPVYFGTLDFE